MNTDNFYMRRLRQLKWGVLGLTALSLIAVESYYYFIRGVPLVENFVNWLIEMVIAVVLIEIVFRALANLQRRLQREISEHKQTVEELREKEEHLRAVITGAPIVLLAIDNKCR